MAGSNYLQSVGAKSTGHKDTTKDHIVDKLIESVLSVSLPSSTTARSNGVSNNITQKSKNLSDEPDFSLSILAFNLRKLNARTGLLLALPGTISHVLSWHQPTLTMSVLMLYTYMCFYPFLLSALPALLVLVGVLIPGYDYRHPISHNLLSARFYKHDSVIEAETERLEIQEMIELQMKKQQAENEKVFIERLRDLQNGLGRLVEVFDKLEHFVKHVGSFKDERRASATYLFLMMLIFSTTYFASFVPPHLAILFTGWTIIICSHPVIRVKVQKFLKEYFEQESFVVTAIKSLEKTEVIIDFEPEERKVELFELQRVGLTPRQWIPWLYTPVVYEPQSALRKRHARPPGTRFLEDAQPPSGWFFKEDEPWVLDTKTKGWVSHRGIRFVELDLENSWAYDYKDNERGEWRRRRWVRKCYSYGCS
jgi:hypothetical protein